MTDEELAQAIAELKAKMALSDDAVQVSLRVAELRWRVEQATHLSPDQKRHARATLDYLGMSAGIVFELCG
jgi:hypothetical protein